MQLIICLLIQYIKGSSNKYYVHYKPQKFRFPFFPDILYGATHTTTTTICFITSLWDSSYKYISVLTAAFLPPQNIIQLMDLELLQDINFLSPWGKPAQLLSAAL